MATATRARYTESTTTPEYAVERLKILAEDIRKVAGWLREHHPAEYESRERLGMLEHTTGVFLEEEKSSVT